MARCRGDGCRARRADGALRGTVRVLRSTDPVVDVLRDAGWRVVAESWGARLRHHEPPDLAPWHALVGAARDRGYDVRELAPAEHPAVVALEARTAADYPSTPATDVPERTAERLAELGVRCFGALARGRLVAVTAVRAPLPGESGESDGLVETAFTSVEAAHRRRGLASAVKAASVVVLAAEGWRVFGTGGAAVNAGSLAMNAAVGYVVEERWLSLEAPASG